MPSDAFFSSPRERRLWLAALAVVVAIYSTLSLAGRLAAALRESGLLSIAFALGFVAVLAAIAASAFERRAGRWEVWVTLGVVAAYLMVVVRMGIGPEERTHIFEYGLVAALIYQALAERARNGRRVPVPALVTVVATALLGWIDEGIQALLPDRVYDLLDVGRNAAAGVLAVAASKALGWARARDRRRPS